jgi:hypothetical protein
VINEDARPIALQIALLIPLAAAPHGLLNGFRMTRLPDPEPSTAEEAVLGGVARARWCKLQLPAFARSATQHQGGLR